MKRFVAPWLGLLALASLCACGRRPELEACDIARAKCQSDVFYAVMRLRGDGWDPFQGVPPIRTITVDRYRAELKKAADEAQKKRDAQAQQQVQQPGEPTAPSVDPWDVTLQLLGLVARTTSVAQAGINSSASVVAAFYASDARNVTVIDRSQGQQQKPDFASDTALLAHELVHAFQDREHTLGAPSTTLDGAFADQGLIEGEAVLYQYLARVEIDGGIAQDIDWTAFYHAHWAEGLRAQLAEESSPYYAVGWFEYPFGGDLMVRAWLSGGNAAVRRLNADVPRHAREFMARYARVASAPSDDFTCTPKPPTDDYTFYARNRMGAMQFYAFMNGQNVEEPLAWKSGLDWRGDEIWLFFDQTTQHVAFSWRIRAKSEKSGAAIFGATRDARLKHSNDANRQVEVGSPEAWARGLRVRGLTLPLRLENAGSDMLIVGSDDADVLTSWPGAVDCTP